MGRGDIDYPIKLIVEGTEEIGNYRLVLRWGDLEITLFSIKTLMRELDRAADLTLKIYRNLAYAGVELTPEVRKVISTASVLLVLVWIAEKIHSKTLNLIKDNVALQMLVTLLLHDELLEKLEQFEEYKEKIELFKKLREIDEQKFGDLLNLLFELLMLLSSKYLDREKRERLKELYEKLKRILAEELGIVVMD